MKKRLYLYILTAIVVVAVAAGVMRAAASSGDPTSLIPETGDPLVMPPYNGELDVAQQDEVAKLADAAIVMPPYNGELDVAQQDEVAKMAGDLIVFPPSTGQLDVAQQDEVAKLSSSNESDPLVVDRTVRRIDLGAGYWLVVGPDSGEIVREGSKSMASVGLAEIPVTGLLEQPPASLNDYTLTQRQRFQVTEPMDESLTAPITGLQEVATTTQRTYLGAGYWLMTGPNGGEIIPPIKSVVEMNQPQTSTSSTQRTDLGGGYWLDIGPEGYNFIH